MRKEVLVAVFIGAVLGLAIAFGIWRANQAFSPKEKIATETGALTPQEEEITEGQLVIAQPQNGALVSQDKITVKGSAQPGSMIVILTNSGEAVTTALLSGNFEQEVELAGGANQISVIAYDKDGNQSQKTVVIVYSTEFPPKE
ncbi:MAG: Ig-like domain-containing protein [bacterium]|nr:Ig-like domain-containing protein [bacterium]